MWGDETSETIYLGVGVREFSIPHLYLDDDPLTGTPSDTSPISVTVRGDDKGQGHGATEILVNNVDPIVGDIIGPVEPVQVGVEIDVSASFTDVGILDTHTPSHRVPLGQSCPSVLRQKRVLPNGKWLPHYSGY